MLEAINLFLILLMFCVAFWFYYNMTRKGKNASEQFQQMSDRLNNLLEGFVTTGTIEKKNLMVNASTQTPPKEKKTLEQKFVKFFIKTGFLTLKENKGKKAITVSGRG